MTFPEALRLHIPAGMYPAFAHMTTEEVRTQTCDDCGKVLAVHPDACWRFRGHVIRCQPCQDKAVRERGYNLQEAMFVE